MHTSDSYEPSRIDQPFPVSFRTLSGETVDAIVQQVVYQTSDTTVWCELVMEVSYNTGVAIVAHEWFHLFHNVYIGRRQPEFKPDRPIEIRAMLRPDMQRSLAERGAAAGDVVQALVADSTDNDAGQPLLNQSECWLALEVRQHAEPSPESAEGDSLTASMLTLWAEQFGDDPHHQEPARISGDSSDSSDGEPPAADHSTNARITRIAQYLQDREIRCEVVEDTLIRMQFAHPLGTWVSVIRVEEEQQVIVVYSAFPILIPPYLLEETALQFMNENFDLIYGSFELDEENGELRYRSTLLNSRVWETDEFVSVLVHHMEVMEHYLPAVQQLVHASD